MTPLTEIPLAAPVLSPGDLLAHFGSPLYVYDAAVIRRAASRFRAAFPYEPKRIHYAIVCNKNRAIVRLLASLGIGIHANTPGDAHAALAAGVPANGIVYSGTNLDSSDLAWLLERGIPLHLDSLDQLRDRAALRTPGEVGLRLLIDDAEAGSRIGVTADELPEAVAISAAAGLRLTTLHMYAGTNTRTVRRFVECFDRLVAASDALPELSALDLGGGYGVAYRPGSSPLDLEELGREVSARMTALSARRGRAIALLLEPGRTLVAESGTLHCRVVSVKERGGRRFVGVDATVGNIVVESVYHAFHRIEAASPRGAELPIPTDVCGNTTHSRDFLARSASLPELRPGDVLSLRDVGAYGYAMSSHFLNRPRPAEVLVDDGDARLVTRRETLDDLLETQL